MNWKVLFKVITLTIALSATVYSIYLLNSKHSGDFFASLGLSSASKTLNWCPERLKKAEGLAGAWTLEEKDRQWILQRPGQPEVFVDYLDIEKWLARYCVIPVTPYPADKLLDLKLLPFAKLNFNDGKQILIYQQEGRVFQINELTFESEEMSKGFKDLQSLLKVF